MGAVSAVEGQSRGGCPVLRPMAAQAIACVVGNNSLHGAIWVVDIIFDEFALFFAPRGIFGSALNPISFI